MLLSTILALAVAGAAAHPLVNTPRESPCTPGVLVCKDAQHFGICPSFGAVIHMAVAAGTECFCDGEGVCNIIAAGSTTASTRGSSIAPSKFLKSYSSVLTTAPAYTVWSPTSSDAPVFTASASSTAPAYTAPTSTSLPAYTPPTTSSAPASSTSSSPPAPSVSTGSAYTQFNGDGSTQDGWPSMSAWLSYEDLWTGYLPLLHTGCNAFSVPCNTDSEIQLLHDNLLVVSQQANVPPQFALAIMMQESDGCLRVGTTTSPGAAVTNPGIFQSHDGPGTCANVQQCPATRIKQMCEDGVVGTTQGPGLSQIAAQMGYGVSGAQKWYEVARVYNSGSTAPDGNLGEDGATDCYCSDIANRLIGWTEGESQCRLYG